MSPEGRSSSINSWFLSPESPPEMLLPWRFGSQSTSMMMEVQVSWTKHTASIYVAGNHQIHLSWFGLKHTIGIEWYDTVCPYNICTYMYMYIFGSCDEYDIKTPTWFLTRISSYTVLYHVCNYHYVIVITRGQGFMAVNEPSPRVEPEDKVCLLP